METRSDNIVPFMAIYPGRVLSEEMEARGLTLEDLSIQLDIPAAMLIEIVSGRQSITMEIASRLETVLGIAANQWLQLQMIYENDLSALQERNEQSTQTHHTRNINPNRRVAVL